MPFSKVKTEDIQFYEREKENNYYDISEYEEKIAREVSEIFRNKRGNLVN